MYAVFASNRRDTVVVYCAKKTDAEFEFSRMHNSDARRIAMTKNHRNKDTIRRLAVVWSGSEAMIEREFVK